MDLESVIDAFRSGNYRVSLHYWERVLEGRPLPSMVVAGITDDAPEVIELREPDPRGMKCLILCVGPNGDALHALIGYEKQPMTLVTAYVPGLDLWQDDFRTRKETGR